MNALGSLVVAEHLLDLRREADAARLANAAGPTDWPARSAAQRLAGRSARTLSRGLAALAARVDPVDTARSSASDRRSRPIAA